MSVNSDAQGNTSMSAYNPGDYFGNATYKQKKIPRHIHGFIPDGWNGCLSLQAISALVITQVQKWFESNASTNIYTSGSTMIGHIKFRC